jgi:hypothetical protein
LTGPIGRHRLEFEGRDMFTNLRTYSPRNRDGPVQAHPRRVRIPGTLRRRFSLRSMLIAVAIVAVLSAIGRVWWRRIDREASRHHRQVLRDFPFHRQYRTHMTNASWRATLEECRLAEEYLGTTPRRFAKGSAIWKQQGAFEAWQNNRISSPDDPSYHSFPGEPLRR